MCVLRVAAGEALGNGECRLRRRSASDTRTGSGVRTPNGWFGGAMEVWVKGESVEGDERGRYASSFSEEVKAVGAKNGRVFTGGGFDDGFASRMLFSELYMTATLVEGEFMVPVRDHPIAGRRLVHARMADLTRHTLTGMHHWRSRYSWCSCTLLDCSSHLSYVAVWTLRG
jgi:hypothetical protein